MIKKEEGYEAITLPNGALRSASYRAGYEYIHHQAWDGKINGRQRTPFDLLQELPSLIVSFPDGQLEELRNKIQRERQRRLSDDNAMAGFLSEAEADADDDHITSVSRRTSTSGEGEGDNKSY